MINKLIILQPVSLCNLNCSYCYVPGRKDAKLMSNDILISCAKVIFNSFVTKPEFPEDKIVISWHAGEPLTAGISFYEKAVACFEKHNIHNVAYDMNIQTNATLINQSWCDFIKSNRFTIGVSVDGPEFIHDFHRKDWNNKGSFARVMRGINLLKENDITLNNICVLTDYSLDYPNEMYSFFKENNFTSVAFNVDEQEGTNTSSSYETAATKALKPNSAQRYKKFLSRFFDLWYEDRRPFAVREFDNLLERIKFYSDNDYNKFIFPTEAIAFANIGISREGDIVTFSPELAAGTITNSKEFVIGNVLNISSFDELVVNSNFKEQLDSITTGVKNCARECEYFDFCGGGSPANKFYEKGSFTATETTYCFLTRKVQIDMMLEKLTKRSVIGNVALSA